MCLCIEQGATAKTPSKELVCNWVKEIWDNLPTKMVKTSFLTCGISNAMDGTEDNLTTSLERPVVTK